MGGGVLLDNEPTVSEHCTLVAKYPWLFQEKHWQLVKGSWFSLSIQNWWDNIWSTVSSSGLHSRRKEWTYCSESSKGPQIWMKDWGIRHTGKNRELRLFSMEKLEGNLFSVYKYPMRECREEGTKLFSVVATDSTSGNKYKMKREKFYLLWCGWPTLKQAAQRGCVVFICKNTQNQTEQCPWQLPEVTLLEQGVWTRPSWKVTSPSAILWSSWQSGMAHCCCSLLQSQELLEGCSNSLSLSSTKEG